MISSSGDVKCPLIVSAYSDRKKAPSRRLTRFGAKRVGPA
jgi:hypothetical protein